MKNLLAIATAVTILLPVSGAFAQTYNNSAASRQVTAMHENKSAANKNSMSHAKSHKHEKKQVKQHKKMTTGKQH